MTGTFTPQPIDQAPFNPGPGAPNPVPEWIAGPNPRLSARANNGSYMVVGTTSRAGGGTSFAIWWYDAAGNPWSNTPVKWPADNDPNYTGDFYPIAVSQWRDGSTSNYITGIGPGDGTGLDVYTIRVESWYGGPVTAVARYDHALLDDRPAVVVHHQNYVYVVATCGTSHQGTNIVTIKYDATLGSSTGTPLHVEEFDSGSELADAAVDALAFTAFQASSFDGGNCPVEGFPSSLFILGTSYRTGSAEDFVTIAYELDPDRNDNAFGHHFGYPWDVGGQGTARFYNNGRVDKASSLSRDGVQLSGSGTGECPTTLFATGASERQRTDGSWDFDWATVAYDILNGGLKWTGLPGGAHRYNGPGDGPDYPRRVKGDGASTDYENYVYVVGGTTGIGRGLEFTVVALRLEDGAQIWLHRIDSGGTIDEIAEDLAVRPGTAADTDHGGIYVVGRRVNGQTYDIFTTRLRRFLGSYTTRWAWEHWTPLYPHDYAMEILAWPGADPYGYEKDLSTVYIAARSYGGGGLLQPDAFTVTSVRIDQTFTPD